MKFTPKQQEVISTRNKNILVSAAAGSGKTSVLVARILSMITDPETPVDIDRFLIVTFTSAAASEMRERIHGAIMQRLDEEPLNENLQRQSALIHNAQITTIDSFCLYLLRNHFHEIGLDPAFRVGDPGEIKLLEKDVLTQTLEEFYAQGDCDFLYFVDAYCPDGKDGKIETLVEELYKFSMSHPWPEKWLDECLCAQEQLNEECVMQTAWMQHGLSYASEVLSDAKQLAEQALAYCSAPAGPYMYCENITADLEMIGAMKERLAQCNDAGAYEACAQLLCQPKWVRMSSKKDESVDADLRGKVKDMRERYKKLVKEIAQITFRESSLAEIVAKEKEAGRLEKVLILITKTFIRNLEAVKREKNVLDFSDMEHYALDILLKDGKLTKTAESYRDYYKAVMIDEYQDSNMVQELLLASVSSQENGTYNRFMVGDMKQSIYRFRMARPEIFMDKYDAYKEESEEHSLICLKQNFRSRREVLDSTNAVFRKLMRPEVGGVVYDDEAALYPGADYPEAEGCASELCLALTTNASSEESRKMEAYLIASKIKALKKDFKVDGRELEYRDIVILLRSGGNTAETIKDILMSEGIPAHVTSKTGYFTATEVSLLMDLLKIMNNPYDDLAFCAVVTSVFFGFSDEELALLTAMSERGSSLYERFRYVSETAKEGQTEEAGAMPADVLPKELTDKIEAALGILSQLREEAVVCSMTELIHKILARFRYVEYVTAMPAGEQRKANVEMLIQKTVDFEKTSYHGLFHFLRYMEQLRKYDVDFGEAAILTETSDVVRIMTIHKSKGLEFPVCFVAGLNKQYNLRDLNDPVLMDADWGVVSNRVNPVARTTGKTMRKLCFARKMRRDSIGEELRILYVAMTRAKEKLIMTAAADEEKLEDVLSSFAPVADEEGKVLSTYRIQTANSALMHILQAWNADHSCLQLTKVYEEDLGRSQVRDISGKMLKEERVRRFEGWQAPLTKEEEVLAQELERRFDYVYPHEVLSKLYTKTSVSELKHAAIEEEGIPVLFETEDKQTEYLPAFMRGQEKVHEGTARGSAMHRVLELVDFREYAALPEENSAMLQKLESDLLKFVEEGRLSPEYSELVMKNKIVGFLGSDLAKRMAKAQEKQALFKEQPFVLAVSADHLDSQFPAEEKVLIQGIVDVYFEEEDGITILDYKTDRVLASSELKERYRTQLDYYEEAIGRLTGKPVKEKILYSFALMEAIGWK